MNVLFPIGGREAIPVRAIPFMTRWETISPDRLANWLSHDDFSRGFHDLFAWRLEEDKPTKVQPNFWENFIVESFPVLNDQIRKGNPEQKAGYQHWQRESIGLLPAGVFVWRDEFEPIYNRRFWPQDADGNALPAEHRDVLRVALEFSPQVVGPDMGATVAEGMPTDSFRLYSFTPLLSNCEGFWDRPFEDLPARLQPVVKAAFAPFTWEDLADASRRKNFADRHDRQHDPRLEPSLYFELQAFVNHDLEAWRSEARSNRDDAKVVILDDVERRLNQILDVDRATVGAEIQRLRAAAEDDSRMAYRNGNQKVKWSVEKKAEAQRLRDSEGLKEAAKRMGVSQTTIRKHTTPSGAAATRSRSSVASPFPRFKATK